MNSANFDFNSPALARKRKVRNIKDKVATHGIGVGGISVIVTIMLIFLYLLYEVAPMFKAASVDELSQYAAPAYDISDASTKTVFLATEEQADVGFRLTAAGQAVFFNLQDGSEITQIDTLEGIDASITSVAEGKIGSRIIALGLSNGEVRIIKHNYMAEYDSEANRTLIPRIEYPYGEDTLELLDQPVLTLAMSDAEESMVLAGTAGGSALQLVQFDKEEDLFSEEIMLERNDVPTIELTQKIDFLVIDSELTWMFAANNSGLIERFNIEDVDAIEAFPLQRVVDENASLEVFRPLLGGLSMLVGDSKGEVSQWFMARDEQNDYQFFEIREFEAGASGKPVKHIAIEERRKGFFSVSDSGQVGIFNTTAHRNLYDEHLIDQSVDFVSIAPRADHLLVEAEGQIFVWEVYNKHPEVSWSSLWHEVWYENYDEPDYIWQSSAATNDFEPKMSLMPLAFGTIKAAFYAMLFAIPLAICGAIYTAYFMAPEWRRKVKPVIELMEALPTVIIGFLAGLFLAPFVETNLTGVFTMLISLPIGILIFGFAWANLPKAIRHRIPHGWDAALLIPVLIFIVWLCLELATPIEHLFFGGDMRAWFTNDLGISFDQRNALVVGLAMGFAVIPSIFSIAEDAIFSVPKHLSHGSLALGATPWQTLVRVVMPTASPGIFSAVMIGMGRAVGETMIVLMATGNTPVMEWNIFEGMRTLAANIAVEVPESEVHSTHYRILFLAAFVLFLFTFVVNTIAELVRQRLRDKYGSL
jgi:phosphate transport system permease protein